MKTKDFVRIIVNGIWQEEEEALTISAFLKVKDDIRLALGNDFDQVIINRSTTLAANTGVTNVLIGTPVSQALAADSLVISNVTASGDVAMYGNLSGNSQQFLMFDASVPALYLGYGVSKTMFGEAGAPAPDTKVHIWSATAGTVSPLTGTLLTIENNNDTYIQFLTPDNKASGILFGNASSNVAAYISCELGTKLKFGIGSADKLWYTAGAFAFQEATTISSTALLTIGGIGTTSTTIKGNLTQSTQGDITFVTSNVANSTGSIRLTIGSNAATAVATWSNVTHTGFVLTHTASINAGTTTSDYATFGAFDTGVSMVEVARLQGAADPYFSMGGSQQFKFYNSGVCDFANPVMFSASVDSALVANQVSLGGYEISADHRALAISQEDPVLVDVDETKFSHKMPVRINGATYYIMLTQT